MSKPGPAGKWVADRMFNPLVLLVAFIILEFVGRREVVQILEHPGKPNWLEYTATIILLFVGAFCCYVWFFILPAMVIATFLDEYELGRMIMCRQYGEALRACRDYLAAGAIAVGIVALGVFSGWKVGYALVAWGVSVWIAFPVGCIVGFMTWGVGWWACIKMMPRF